MEKLGYTLLELLITMTIIAILSLMTVSTGLQVIEMARSIVGY